MYFNSLRKSRKNAGTIKTIYKHKRLFYYYCSFLLHSYPLSTVESTDKHNFKNFNIKYLKYVNSNKKYAIYLINTILSAIKVFFLNISKIFITLQLHIQDS